MAQPKASNESQPADCCGACEYFQMADSPEAVKAVQTPTLVTAVQGCCLRYPPSVFPVGQKNMIAGAELAIASVSVRVVVGATDWCGEFTAHGPLQ